MSYESDADIAIEVADVSKQYQIYSRPQDRLFQIFSTSGKKYYSEFWALRHINLKIPKGQTVGIVGRNGSGKSTLLQIICGTLSPTAGSVRVTGRVAALLELGAGFNPEFTGTENIYLAASLYGLTRTQIQARLPAIADFADIGDHIRQPVKTYSSGMYVRLAFAIVANVDADVLIIDEALAVGDVFFVQKCMRFLRDFKSRGTLLFVSHDMQSVIALCSSAILLEAGSVSYVGSPKEVSERYLAQLHREMQLAHHPAPGELLPAETSAGDLVTETREVNSTNEGADFGVGLARVDYVSLLDLDGNRVSLVRAGARVRLQVSGRATADIQEALVGFIVRDRIGQIVFGENTGSQISADFRIPANGTFEVAFEFEIPHIQTGKYVISAAVGQGTQNAHVHHHWRHDAAMFECVNEGRCFGVISLAVTGTKISTCEAC